MEKCLYNNESIYAIDVKNDFNYEEHIRKIGTKNMLICPGCSKPVIFKRGEIRDAHFAHKELSSQCEYDIYTKANSKRSLAWREVKEILYNHFCNIDVNYKVIKEDKIISKHWTDLSININETKIAIEIDDKKISANKLNYIKNQYKNNDIKVDWIILDRVTSLINEANVYFIKRALLNENDKNTLYVIDKDSYEFAVYKLDTKEYYYNNSKLRHIFKENIFIYTSDICDLLYNENGLYIKGFDEKYNIWRKKREIEFKLKQLELSEKIFTWNADLYLEYINRISSGEEYLIDIIALSLEKNSEKREFYEFIEVYKNIKISSIENQLIKYLSDIIENLLIKSNNEKYIFRIQ